MRAGEDEHLIVAIGGKAVGQANGEIVGQGAVPR
jgi:hypothetical protein